MDLGEELGLEVLRVRDARRGSSAEAMKSLSMRRMDTVA